MIVDDDPDVVGTLKIILEGEHLQVLAAKTASEALKVLRVRRQPPDIILCDILMPGMNGYDFFKAISRDPRLNRIPFVFLSALSTVEDVRLGKLLGADDYIPKPFEVADLLAIVRGKLARVAAINDIVDKLNPSIQTGDQPVPGDDNSVFIMIVNWDDRMGPLLRQTYPDSSVAPFSFNELSYRLFGVSSALIGEDFTARANDALLTLANVDQTAYLFFDSHLDDTFRAHRSLYMIAVIAPVITYFESLQLRSTCIEISTQIKMCVKLDAPVDLSLHYAKISRIIGTAGEPEQAGSEDHPGSGDDPD